MTWVKLDDRFPSHPKLMPLPVSAKWSFIVALCYAGEYETDGCIPRALLSPKDAGKLVGAGLLERLESGDYMIHDFLIYNPSAERLTEDRRKARERMAKGGKASSEVRAKKSSPGPVPVPRPQNLRSKTLARQPQPRDELFETVAEVCNIDWHDLTSTSRGSLNKAVSELKSAGATPDEVRRRVPNFPFDVPLTPPGLAKHWPAMGSVQATPSSKTKHITALADQLEADGL